MKAALLGVAGMMAVLAFPASLRAQIVQLGANIDVGEDFKNVPALPVPRLPNGRVDLGAPAGQPLGTWLPLNSINERLVNQDDRPADTAPKFSDKPNVSDVPFQPWSRELYNYRRGNQFEPHTRCKPSAGPRQFLTPYGVEFVDRPELQRIFIMDLGGPHTYREIYMDGRSHPSDLTPSYYGHSIGKWEGDTLVVDSRGYNESFWIDRLGMPHTDKLHMIERFTRTDSKTMKYEVTIDDPGAYTAIWKTNFMLGWDPDQELFEYVCQDNNLAGALLVGSQETVDRSSSIVP
jgi:hypothetical protein